MDLDEFRERLTSPDEVTRLQVLNEAIDFQCPCKDGVDCLLATCFAREQSLAVRESILFLLQRKHCTQSYPAVFSLFKSDDAFLRNAAMSIMGAGGESALDFLTTQTLSSNREVRKLILDALVQIGTPRAVVLIRKALTKDTAPNVRITAAGYLGRLHDVESIDLLLKMFQEDNEPMFRLAVLESVSGMQDPEAAKKLFDLPLADLCEDEIQLFLPVLIGAAGRSGRMEKLARLLARTTSLALYAEDIIAGLQNVESFDTMLGTERKNIEKALYDILWNIGIREDLRYSALTLLGGMGSDFVFSMSAEKRQHLAATFAEKDFCELVKQSSSQSSIVI